MERGKQNWLCTVPAVAALMASVMVLSGLFPTPSSAASTREIDVSVDVALERFEKEVKGSKSFMESA